MSPNPQGGSEPQFARRAEPFLPSRWHISAPVWMSPLPSPSSTTKLVAFLESLSPSGVVLEATEAWRRLADALELAAIPVAIINPRQARDFAGHRKAAKTDAIDALVLARAQLQRLLADAQTRELRSLVERRRQLVEMLTAEETGAGRPQPASAPCWTSTSSGFAIRHRWRPGPPDPHLG